MTNSVKEKKMNIVNLVVRMLVNECETYHEETHKHFDSNKEFSKRLEKEFMSEALVGFIASSPRQGFGRLKDGFNKTKVIKVDYCINDEKIEATNNLVELCNNLIARLKRNKSLITCKENTLLNAYLLTFINQLKEGVCNE